MLTLYYAPGTCALASHLSLEHAKADYVAQRLDFRKDEQRSPDYLEINPKARVPALATPQGVLTETPALLQYIAQLHPQSGLAPVGDAFALAKFNEFNAYLCATVHVNHAHRPRAYRWADDPAAIEAMQRKVPQTMTESFRMIEDHWLQGPWVFGDRLTASDYYLFTIATWLPGDGVDVAQFPKVNALCERLKADPLVQRVLAAQKA
jgi:glutathione S-transferase